MLGGVVHLTKRSLCFLSCRSVRQIVDQYFHIFNNKHEGILVKKVFLLPVLFGLVSPTFAADERTAAAVVKKYSEAIACQISEPAVQRNQYKTVKIDAGMTDLGGLGAKFVVFWEGDVGCAGGNSTVVPNFTVVEQSGFTSVPPVVMPNYKFPDIDIVKVTNIVSNKDGILLISGLAYGAKDQQHVPTKKVGYALKLVDDQFVKQ